MSFLKFVTLSFASLTFCFAVVETKSAAVAASFSIVADGLDNVRGLSFSPEGSLYVTEAGVGGSQLCSVSFTFPGQQACIGSSGAVTRIKDGKQERVLTNLPSYALSPTGSQAIGANDIEFNAAGNPYLLIGLSAGVNYDNTPFNSPNFGELYKVDFNTGAVTSIADISSYEFAKDPTVLLPNDAVGSNPYSFTIEGDTAYIANANRNEVLSVKLDGSNLKTLVEFPNQTITTPTQEEITYQAVPTGVAIGPDQALYVSQLTGVPIPEGGANIFRVGSDGKATVYADGFTQLTDLDFDTEGNLYALQFANQAFFQGNFDGSLIQIAKDGTRRTLLSGNGLESATALTIGPDGAVYVSSKGDRAGVGKVLRIDPKAKIPESNFALSVVAFSVLGVSSFIARKSKL